jgi:hypothetical protein
LSLCARSCIASCVTFRMSATPAVTALSEIKCALLRSAIRCASAVLPTPGGPYSMSDMNRSVSMALRRSLPVPRICSCPKNSDRSRGRILHARGGGMGSTDRDSSCVCLLKFLRPNVLNCGRDHTGLVTVGTGLIQIKITGDRGVERIAPGKMPISQEIAQN